MMLGQAGAACRGEQRPRHGSDFASHAKQIGLTPAQITMLNTCVQTLQHKALVQAITENASKRASPGRRP